MKKLSVSLFALLAIVFAVSSAFTTKSKTFAPNTWEQFGVASLSSTSPTASGVLGQKISDAFNQTQGTSMNDIDAKIAAFNSTSLPQVRCSSDNSQVCAAIISYRDNTSQELALEDFNTGDYSLQ